MPNNLLIPLNQPIFGIQNNLHLHTNYINFSSSSDGGHLIQYKLFKIPLSGWYSPPPI